MIKIITTILLISLIILIIVLGYYTSIQDTNNIESHKVTRESDLIIQTSDTNQTSYLTDSNSIDKSESNGQSPLNTKETIPSLNVPIKLRVLKPYGTPAPEAKITFIKISNKLRDDFLQSEDHFNFPFEMYETTSDSNGYFYFSNISSDHYLIHVELDGFGPAHCDFDLRKEIPEELNLFLTWEKCIKGIVIDINNNPISDVLVEISLPYLPVNNLFSMPAADAIDIIKFHGVQHTDSNGRFEIHNQPDTNLYLTIEEGPIEKYAPVLRPIATENRSEHVIVLKLSCHLRGKVTDNKGLPIENAYLNYLTFENGNTSFGRYVSTDANGIYHFDDIQEGRVFVEVKHSQYGNASCFTNITSVTANNLDFILSKGLSKKVYINDSFGKPLNNIRVTVKDVETGSLCANDLTDQEGKCIVNSLVYGHTISIQANAFDKNINYELQGTKLLIEDDSDFVIILKNSLKIIFSVYNETTKQQINDFSAILIGGNSIGHEEDDVINQTTSNIGKIAWKISNDYNYYAWFFAEGYEPQRIDIDTTTDANEKTYDVYLKPGRRLSGIIIDSNTGDPITGADVKLAISSRKSNRPLFSAGASHSSRTNDQGIFSLNSLPSSSFTLRVSAPGYADVFVQSDTLSLIGDPSENIVSMDMGSSISGRLMYGDDYPVQAGIVEAFLHSGEKLKTVNATPLGFYSITNLPAGKIRLRVSDTTEIYIHGGGDYWHFIKEVVLPPGENLNVDFLISGRARIAGTCTADNKEVLGIAVSLLDPETREPFIFGETDDAGKYILSPVPEGQYIIVAESRSDGIGGALQKEIKVPEEGELVVNFSFEGMALNGNIIDQNGKPKGGCWLTLIGQEDQGIYKAYSAINGQYMFYNIPEGMYDILLVAPGYSVLEDEVTISAAFPMKKDYSLRPEGVLKLAVEGPDSKESAAIVAMISDPEGYSGKTISNAKGIFAFKNLEEGKVTAVAGGGLFAPASKKAGITAGETTEESVHLSKGGFLIIDAQGKNAQPLNGAYVSFEIQGLAGMSWKNLVNRGFIKTEPKGFVTSEDGIFKIGPLPFGSYTLKVKHGASNWSGQAKVTPGSITKVKAIL